MKTQLFLGAVLVQFLAVGQTSIQYPDCADFNELVIARAIANRLDEAEAAISAAVSNGKSVCAGVALGNVAVLLSIRGHIRDSEAFAARSVDLLKNADPDDPMLFRSLHALAIARLEQGKLRKAEQAFEQMLQIRAERPEQRGQVHITTGVLLHLQGKWKEAESEYLLAHEEWKQSGKTADTDATAVLYYLGALYITEERFKEAAQVLDRALAIVEVAEDALPMDRIKLLNLRAAAHGRQGEWPEALEKLCQAISIAEGVGVSEPAVLRLVLDNYAIALRKNHHRKEARVIESRASALPRDPSAGAIIDIRELSSTLRAHPH